MNRWVRGISWLLAVVLACDGMLGALAHSHGCPNHNHATAWNASHDDSDHDGATHNCDCDHVVTWTDSSHSTPAPASPNAPDEGCAACRYLAQSVVFEFSPNFGPTTDCVAGFVPPLVASVESSVLRVHYSRGPPASC